MKHRSKPEYFKLSAILTKSNKTVCLISFVAAVMGFIFLFVFSALSQTIIETKQKAAADTYGRFLTVISDLDQAQIETIRDNYRGFEDSVYEVTGNVQYGSKRITMGKMEEKLGKDLGFSLEKGEWPSAADEIVIEEYLESVFHIGQKSFPCTISLQINGKKRDYKITGVISNYSSMLSVCDDLTIDTNVYPSIISGGSEAEKVRKTLVIRQKKLNYKKVEKDIYTITSMLNDIDSDIVNISANMKLYEKGYMDNKDMIDWQQFYQIILNSMLILAQIVILRYFLVKNRKILSLFQALGLSEKQKIICISLFMGGWILFAFSISVIVALFVGNIVAVRMFEGYHHYFFQSFLWVFIVECMVIAAAAVCAGIMLKRDKDSSVIDRIKGNYNILRGQYGFPMVDAGIIFAGFICMFFVMAAIHFAIMFQIEEKDMEYILYSKSTGVSQPVAGYNISENGERFFSFDSISRFQDYEKYLHLSMDAETKYSSLLLDKDCKDEYFFQPYFEAEMGEEEPFRYQIPAEAEDYKVIPDSYVNIRVLPSEDYDRFLQTNEIQRRNLQDETDDSCILILPDYHTSDERAAIKENGIVRLGRLEYGEEGLVFRQHSFSIKKILIPENSDDSRIQLVMSEKAAKSSRFISGYDSIRITMDKDCPTSIQTEIDGLITSLMASVQGGRMDSSVQIDQNDSLLQKYTAILSRTVLIFAIVLISIYIPLSSYVDWENHRYEYGVLRSMGMSYSALQHKLLLKYGTSILIAAVAAVLIGNQVFSEGSLQLWQIGISVLTVVVVTCLCRAWLYVKNMEQSIALMLKD